MLENLKTTAQRLKKSREANLDETLVLIEQIKLRKEKTEDTQKLAELDITIHKAEMTLEFIKEQIAEYDEIIAKAG